MRSGVYSSFEFLSMSTLDLFASILGTFVLITFVLLPYYLAQPLLEHDIAQAQAETSALAAELRLYREKLTATRTARSNAEGALAAAQHRLAVAKARAAAQPSPKDEKKPAPSPLPTPFAINDLDVVFVMDTTGSMCGEVSDLQANLLGILRILHRLAPTLRAGFVAFKDHGDAYVTKAFPLGPMERTHFQEIAVFVRQLSAEGGGDDPEPVDEALRAAITMPWRSDAQGQIVLIGDAPPRTAGWQRAIDIAADFRRSAPAGAPPRAVSAIFTGRQPHARAFFELVAGAGGGLFTPHQGRMIESVLLAVLRPANEDKVARQ